MNPRGRPPRPFWSFVEKTDGCWLWTGVRNPEGYGFFMRNKRAIMAHRHSYEEALSPIPTGLVIDHLCRVTACVRPDHLEAVTQRVNILRGYGAAAKNYAKTNCLKGHPLTPRPGYTYRWCLPCRREDDALRKRTQRARRRAA